MENNLFKIENRIDTSSMTNFSPNSGEVAFDNVKKATSIGANPDDFAKDPKAYEGNKARPLNKAITNRMGQSAEQAKAMSEDMGAWEYLERQFKYAKDLFSQTDKRRELSDLVWDYKFGDKVTNDEEDERYYRISSLMSDLNEENVAAQHDQTFVGGLPAEQAQALYDMFQGLGDRSDVLLGTIGAGAALAGGTAALTGLAAGPIGALSAGGAAAATGAVASIPFALKLTSASDQFKQTFTSLYADGIYNNKVSNPTQESELTSISLGVATSLSLLEFAQVDWILKRVPWLKRRMKSTDIAGELAKPANRKYLDFFSRLGQTMIGSGATETGQELVQSIAEDAIKNIGEDGNISSAIGDTLEKIYKGDEQTLQRLGKAAILGSTTGAAIQVAGEAVGAVVDRQAPTQEVDLGEFKVPTEQALDIESDITFSPEEVKLPVEQASASMRMSIIINRIAQVAKTTKTNDVLPSEMEIIIEDLADEAGLDGVYVDKDELNSWVAQDEDKAAMVRDILDESQTSQADVDAPIRLPIRDAVLMTMKNKDITSLFKYNPESISVAEWAREASDEDLTKFIDAARKESYLEQQTFTDDKANAPLTSAKKDVVKALRKDVKSGENIQRVEELTQKRKEVVDLQTEYQSLVNNPNLETLNSFLESKSYFDTTTGQLIEAEDGKKVFYIDPNSLSESQKALYLNDPTLKKRGVFKAGGMDIEGVAGLLNQPNGDVLLNILKTTPDRTEARSRMKQNFDKQIELEQEAAKRARNLSLSKAYDNVTKAHVEEAKVIAAKLEVEQDVMSFEEIQATAQDRVGATRLRDLNPTQWKIGERVSQTKARKAYQSETNIEDALQSKTNAALNSQLAKYSHEAIANTNRAITWIASLETKRNQNLLKVANPMYGKALDSLKAVFKIDESVEINEENSKAWNDFTDKYFQEYGFNLKIPDSVNDWVSGLNRMEDMTVDQMSYASNLMKIVVHEARREGVLYVNPLEELDVETVDVIAEFLKEQGEKHPQFNPSRIIEGGTPRFRDKIISKIRRADAFLDNYQFITREADEGVTNGPFMRSLWNPLLKGMNKRNEYKGNMIRKFNDVVKTLGGKKYLKELQNTVVKVDEFSTIKQLRYGRMTKLELVTILANYGNLENRQRLTNYGVDDATILRALEKHLDFREARLVQEGIWDNLKVISKDVLDLERQTKGNDLELVREVPFSFRGKKMKGGYFPLRYMVEGSIADKLNELDREVNPVAHPDLNQIEDGFYDGVIVSPHTKERVGSDNMVDFNFDNVGMMFDSIAHDLGMRIPNRDVNKLLQNKDIQNTLVSIVGKEKVDVLIETIRENTRRPPVTQVYKEAGKLVDDFVTKVESGAYVSVLVGNFKSWSMASLTIPQMIGNKGASSVSFMRSAAMRSLNKTEFKYMLEFAAENDPSISGMAEGMNLFHRNALARHIPKGTAGRTSDNALVRIAGQSVTPFRNLADLAIDINFEKILGNIDLYFKVINFNASYAQFLEGKADGWSLDKLNKMTKDQQNKAAIDWAVNMNHQSTMVSDVLNKAPIQKVNSLARSMTRFWNEPRNFWLSRRQEVRNIKNLSKKIVEASRSGDQEKAAQLFHSQVDNAMTFVVTTAMVNFLMDAIDWYWNDEDDRQPMEFLSDELEKSASRMKLSPSAISQNIGDLFQVNSIPVLSSVAYGAKSRGDFDTLLTSSLGALSGTWKFATAATKELEDGMTLAEIASVMNEKEFRDFLTSLGMFTGKVPVKGIFNTMKLLDDAVYSSYDMSKMYESINTGIDSMNENLNTEPYKNLINDMNNYKTGPQQKMETETNNISDEDYNAIKFAESSGKWNAGSRKSSAFGIYQFTKSTWEEVINSPEGQEAGLTMSGWTSKDTSQQEKAMRIHSAWVMDELYVNEVAINVNTVYFGHHFGLNAVANHANYIFTKEDSAKLPKGFPSKGQRNANPWLKDVWTVGEFKRGLANILNRGKEESENARP